MANATKKAVLRALIEGSLYEILVKSNIENVVYSVDGSGNEVYLSTKLAEIITDLGTKATTTSVTEAINALRAEMLGDTPVEAYNTFTELAQYIAEHKDAADALTAAVGNKADKSTVEGIQAVINGLGALATKSTVSESDLDSALKEKVNAAAEGNHSHANKALLDTYDQTNADLKDAVAKKHEHSNKAELDKIVEGDKAKWDKAVTDLSEEITRAKTAEGANATAAAEAKAAAAAAQATADAAKQTADNIKHPEYSVVKATDSGEYAAVYHLTKDGVNVGASINIPKDLVVKSGSVVGNEIVLVLNDAAATQIKIPVGSLIEYVTSGSVAGDMVVISVDESTHKVTATITDGTITKAKLTAEVQAELNKAHEHSNKSVLDGITAQKVTAWDAAEQNAKDHANSLNSAMDTRVKAVEADKHTHGNKTVLDGITAQQVAAWTGKSRIIYSATQPADLGENDLWVQLL